MLTRRIGTDWMEQAACAGACAYDAFADEARQRKFALAFCQQCPVREDCLEYAQTNKFVYGVFGGMTDAQRRRLMGIREKIA